MEPGRRDREQSPLSWPYPCRCHAAMEPGRRDREQGEFDEVIRRGAFRPQWSPVDVTGNRRGAAPTTPTRGGRNGARST